MARLTLEVCELAEMLALAVRWTRNLFCESQLHHRHVPFLEWRSQRTPTTETARPACGRTTRPTASSGATWAASAAD